MVCEHRAVPQMRVEPGRQQLSRGCRTLESDPHRPPQHTQLGASVNHLCTCPDPLSNKKWFVHPWTADGSPVGEVNSFGKTGCWKTGQQSIKLEVSRIHENEKMKGNDGIVGKHRGSGAYRCIADPKLTLGRVNFHFQKPVSQMLKISHPLLTWRGGGKLATRPKQACQSTNKKNRRD